MNTTLASRRTRQGAAHPGATARMALLVVLASEIIFFTTLLSAYFYLRQDQASWPAASFTAAQLILPAANTLIIVLSAATMGLSLNAVSKSHPGQVKLWLAATLLLGLVFVGLQILEFTRSGMHPNDQTFGGVFFTLMGFHAVHVLAGVVMLVTILWRAFLGDFTPRRHVAIQIGTWFWYFIVGVWVVLFTALYLL